MKHKKPTKLLEIAVVAAESKRTKSKRILEDRQGQINDNQQRKKEKRAALETTDSTIREIKTRLSRAKSAKEANDAQQSAATTTPTSD